MFFQDKFFHEHTLLQIIYISTFKRDIKKIKKRRKDMTKFRLLLSLLINEKSIPQKYHNHKLSGNYKDFWECHIEPDWLLIYRKDTKYLELARTGSHSDLF